MTTIPEGWQLVPKAVTGKMVVAGVKAYNELATTPWNDEVHDLSGALEEVFDAMCLAAAPAPPGDAGAEDVSRPDKDFIRLGEIISGLRLSASDVQSIARIGAYTDSLRATNARMREAISRASATLQVPAAEYVPAMSDAWTILDEAVHTTFTQEQP